jgi:PAS domain S-box-containing protein
MDLQSMTKQALIAEVEALRRRLAEIEAGSCEQRASDARRKRLAEVEAAGVQSPSDAQPTEIGQKQALKLKEYDRLIEASPNMVCLVDAEYRYRLANGAYIKHRKAGRDITGRSVPEILGKAFDEGIREKFERCFQGEVVEYETNYTNDKGDQGTLLICLSPLAGPSGIDRVACISRDITEQKRLDKTLRKSERRYRGLFDTLPDGFFAAGEDRRIVEANGAFAAMVGHSRDELAGMSYEDLTPETWRAPERDIVEHQVAVRGYSDVYEKEYTRKDGTIFPAEVRVHLDRGAAPRPRMWAFVRDISARKRAEEALKRKERELEENARNLAEVNTALKVLLKHTDEEKESLKRSVASNVKELVFPYLEKLKGRNLTDYQTTCLSIIESNLNEVVSPFLQRMTREYARFTPMELQMASLIRNGRTNKEIAEVLNVGVGTIHWHRNNIRAKLGLNNKDVNLRTYLLSLRE